ARAGLPSRRRAGPRAPGPGPDPRPAENGRDRGSRGARCDLRAARRDCRRGPHDTRQVPARAGWRGHGPGHRAHRRRRAAARPGPAVARGHRDANPHGGQSARLGGARYWQVCRRLRHAAAGARTRGAPLGRGSNVRDTRRTRLVLAAAVVTALALIAIDYQNGSSSVVTSLRNGAGSVFGGAERAFTSVTRPVGRFFGGGSSAGSGSEQHQLVRMRAELSAARLDRAQYRQLRRLLQLSGRGGYRVLAATVIAYGQGYQQTVTLDAGRADG